MQWNTAIILSWGIMYLACSIFTPNIGLGSIFLFLYGVFMIIPLMMQEKYKSVSNALFLVMGVSESVGALLSWTGLIVWNLNVYGNQALYQVTMAFMDFIASVALFSKVLFERKK